MQYIVLDWHELEGPTGKNVNMKIAAGNVRELLLMLFVVNFIRNYYLEEIALIV